MSKKQHTTGPMDKDLKRTDHGQMMMDKQHGGSSQSVQLNACGEEEEAHTTHSFRWRHGDKKHKDMTCNKAGTIEKILQRSQIFSQLAGKNKEKELVIKRKGRAIATHFPCCLIEKDQLLIVKYIKAGKQHPGGAVHKHRKNLSSDKLITFNIAIRGGKVVRNILSNAALKKEVEEISVYAYKGELVKQALKRDGRLSRNLFSKHIVLSELSEEDEFEMSNIVDNLDGKSFKIILHDKSTQPESQSGSLDDAYVTADEPQTAHAHENQDPEQQCAASESVNNQIPEERAVMVRSATPEESRVHKQLSAEFTDYIKGMKKSNKVSKLSDVQNLFRAEFGKNVQICLEVKMVKKLMELSKSVCQVRINGQAEGSGFLLFGKFVLTNGHVISHIYDQDNGQLREAVTVTFSFESLDQDPCETVQVKLEVTAIEYGLDVSGYQRDWALLELCTDQTLPDGLLQNFGFLPPRGGICIIGHPDGGVKKIDPCLIIQHEQREKSVVKHQIENGCYQLVTDKFFSNKQILSYDTSFYFGSSGSPVFDEHCNVIAMHSGGYHYKSAKGQTQSIIEYAHPLSLIIEQIILCIVTRERFDVLREFLKWKEPNQKLMEDLKKIVASRNLTFENAFNNAEVANDENLKAFFDFLALKEEPVSMDIDN